MIPNADGLDLSHWNVVTDEAAIHPYKLMSCKATEGRRSISKAFATYWAMFARMAVRHRGAYHWVRSDSSMKAQVDHLAATLDLFGGLQVGDFVQLDWETTPGIPNMEVDQIEEWVDLAHARWGERLIVYGSDWVPNFLAWRKANPTVPVWYANYNTSDKPTGGWAECAKYNAAVWQWSSTFKAPGFLWNPDEPTDGVDVNHVFDWATLDRLTLRQTVEHPEQPEPSPVQPPVEEPPMQYLFKLAGSGGYGIRDVTGARPLNGGEGADESEGSGPFGGEKVWHVPAGSNWESWVNRELAKYYRELDPPVAAGPVGEQTVRVDVNVTGPA